MLNGHESPGKDAKQIRIIFGDMRAQRVKQGAGVETETGTWPINRNKVQRRYYFCGALSIVFLGCRYLPTGARQLLNSSDKLPSIDKFSARLY
jgi:hypothetical protein